MIDSNGPVLNTRLVNAMQEMLKDNNEKTRAKMVSALMGSTLLSPVVRQIAVTDEAKKQGNARFSFTMIQNDKGDFAAIVLRKGSNMAGFVINAYGENVTISRDLIISLKKQKDEKNNH